MQCSCGDSTITRDRPKVRKGVVVAKVELDECPSCTRVGECRIFEVDPDSGNMVLKFKGHPSKLV